MQTKEEAISKLLQIIDLIEGLRSKPSSSPDFKKWHLRAGNILSHVFGDDSRQKEDFSKISFFLFHTTSNTLESDIRSKFLGGLDEAEQLLRSFVEEIVEFGYDRYSFMPQNDILIVTRLSNRFHLVAKQLQTRYNNRNTLSIGDEYDVQDLFHAILMLEFDDVRAEEWTPSYVGSASRIDFLLKKESIAIELKKTREKLVDKQIGDQLIIDIAHYQSHPDCHTLVCFVYDPEGLIKNPRGLESDLNGNHNGLEVIVVISPRMS